MDIELTPEQLEAARKRIGAEYAARRRTVEGVCAYPGCGKVIRGLPTRRYCSASHRVMDVRRRKREREKQ